MDTATFQKNGVIKIKNFFDLSECDRVRDEYLDIISKNPGNKISKVDPIVVLWTHVKGKQKMICTLPEMKQLQNRINQNIVPFLKDFVVEAYPHINTHRLQLLETIIFNKPPKISNILNWHQDVSYFPLKPNNQIAVWFPLTKVTSDIGPLTYAHGSHKLGIRGSTDLHTRMAFDGEDRELIPDNPEDIGLEVTEYEMTPQDLLIHDGFTWHYSKPNVSNEPRMGVSVRFIIEKAYFDPRPGQGAAFTKQINVKSGEEISSSCFPLLWEEGLLEDK